MRRAFSVRVGSVEAEAELDPVSGETGAAFWRSLPFETELRSAIWSGEAATFRPPAAVTDAARGAAASANDIAVGTLAVAAPDHGGVALIAYGTALHHTALGPAPVVAIGRVTREREALFGELERTSERGALRIAFAAIDR